MTNLKTKFITRRLKNAKLYIIYLSKAVTFMTLIFIRQLIQKLLNTNPLEICRRLKQLLKSLRHNLALLKNL